MNYCEDFSRPEIFFETTHVARKEHKCSECKNIIKSGENYTRTFGKWDNEISVYKTCSICQSFRDYILDNIPCFCYTYSDLIWQGVDTLQEYKDELPGILFTGLRILALGKQYYKTRDNL